MQRLFPRSIDALAMIAHFVDEFIAANRLGQGASFSVNLVIEELFTNMVKYSSGGAEEISVQLESRDDRIVLQMIDYDVE